MASAEERRQNEQWIAEQDAKRDSSGRIINPTSYAENEAGYAAGARRGSVTAPGGGWEYASNIYNADDDEFDSDLYRAAILQRYLRGEGGLQNQVKSYAGDLNTDVARSAMNNLLARASQRRGMKQQLSGLSALQGQEELLLKREAENAVGQGVKNTRQNFNRRGLLYGGMREGGEDQVRAQGAATLSRNLAESRQDYANQSDALKRSIATLGLQAQQESQQRLAQVQESAVRNQIARLQAYQQLGEGLGYAGGYYFGSQGKPGTSSTPVNYNNAAITGGSYREMSGVA